MYHATREEIGGGVSGGHDAHTKRGNREGQANCGSGHMTLNHPLQDGWEVASSPSLRDQDAHRARISSRLSVAKLGGSVANNEVRPVSRLHAHWTVVASRNQVCHLRTPA